MWFSPANKASFFIYFISLMVKFQKEKIWLFYTSFDIILEHNRSQVLDQLI